jgi:molybdate transport system substrate-binding protein
MKNIFTAFLFAVTTASLSVYAAARSVPQTPPALQLFCAKGALDVVEKISPVYEATFGRKLIGHIAPARGSDATTIPSRLAEGERADVFLLDRMAISKLQQQGHIDSSSCADFGKSYIALAIPLGRDRPVIRSMEEFKQTLLDAKSIAYSESASGLYLENVLFNLMGVKERIAPKLKRITGKSVGEAVASGEAEIGLEQVSELSPLQGIDIVGLIPDQAQKMTLYTACMAPDTSHPEEARQFIKYISSNASFELIKASGLQPIVDPDYELHFKKG